WVVCFYKGYRRKYRAQKAFEIFVEAAKKGADSTIPLVAKKGRAMRLGERAIGHLDPGAASSVLILETFRNNLP
ncbi:Dak phosphatase, partial [Thermoanaerobacter ethanolicus JW 200]